MKLRELKLMPHGFLSYNIPILGMKEESMAGIKLGSEWLRELLGLSNGVESPQSSGSGRGGIAFENENNDVIASVSKPK